MQSLPEVGPRVGDLSCPPRRGVVSARQLPHAPSARVFSSRHAACAAPSAALPGGAAVRFRRGGGWLRSPFLLPVSRACACGGMTSNTDYRMALRCLSSRTRMLSRLVPCGKEDFTFTIRSIEFLTSLRVQCLHFRTGSFHFFGKCRPCVCVCVFVYRVISQFRRRDVIPGSF